MMLSVILYLMMAQQCIVPATPTIPKHYCNAWITSPPPNLMLSQQNNGMSEAIKNCIEKTGNPVLCMAEPIDVPAVTGAKNCIWYKGNVKEPVPCGFVCKDASRVLLISEDGHGWCHKVQP